MALSDKDIEILEQIRSADQLNLFKGKASDGKPFLQHVFRLYQKMFGQDCVSCPDKIPGYIAKLKNYKTTSVMKNTAKTESKFALNKGVIIPVRGTSKVISENNLTDEDAIRLLRENPERKQLFKTVPDNLKELLDAEPTNDEPSFVSIGEHQLSVEQAKEVLAKSGIKTQAGTIEGLNKRVGSLSKADLKKVTGAADELLAAASEPAQEPDAEQTRLQNDFNAAKAEFDALGEDVDAGVRETAQAKLTDAETALNAYVPVTK